MQSTCGARQGVAGVADVLAGGGACASKRTAPPSPPTRQLPEIEGSRPSAEKPHLEAVQL